MEQLIYLGVHHLFRDLGDLVCPILDLYQKGLLCHLVENQTIVDHVQISESKKQEIPFNTIYFETTFLVVLISVFAS